MIFRLLKRVGTVTAGWVRVEYYPRVLPIEGVSKQGGHYYRPSQQVPHLPFDFDHFCIFRACAPTRSTSSCHVPKTNSKFQISNVQAVRGGECEGGEAESRPGPEADAAEEQRQQRRMTNDKRRVGGERQWGRDVVERRTGRTERRLRFQNWAQ